jgi:hypothetical protein
MLFIEPINLDSEIGQEVELVRSSGDRRVQHTEVRGSPTKALSIMNEIDGRT